MVLVFTGEDPVPEGGVTEYLNHLPDTNPFPTKIKDEDNVSTTVDPPQSQREENPTSETESDDIEESDPSDIDPDEPQYYEETPRVHTTTTRSGRKIYSVKRLIVLEEEEEEMHEAEKVPSECLSPRSQESDNSGDSFIAGSGEDGEEEEEGDTEMESEEGQESE